MALLAACWGCGRSGVAGRMAQHRGDFDSAPIAMAALWPAARRFGRSITPGFVWGAAVALLSLVWFAMATFVIVPRFAAPLYGVAESGYFARYGALGNSPLDIVRCLLYAAGCRLADSQRTGAPAVSVAAGGGLRAASAAGARCAAVGVARAAGQCAQRLPGAVLRRLSL